MSVVIEAPTRAESIFATRPSEARTRQQRPAPRGRRHERWTSTLSPGDLNCLLKVIEDDLLPQLLTDYSPARHAAALEARDSSG